MVLQKTDASKRPFETVKPLAVELGMTPEVGVRTPETGGVNVFDNRFKVDKHKVSAATLWGLASVVRASASTMCCRVGRAQTDEQVGVRKAGGVPGLLCPFAMHCPEVGYDCLY